MTKSKAETWGLGLGTHKHGDVGTQRCGGQWDVKMSARRSLGTHRGSETWEEGLKDVINKQHMIFVLNF